MILVAIKKPHGLGRGHKKVYDLIAIKTIGCVNEQKLCNKQHTNHLYNEKST